MIFPMRLRRLRILARARSFPSTGIILLFAILVASSSPRFCRAQHLKVTPLKGSGVYELGEAAGWSIAVPDHARVPQFGYSYTIKKNNQDVIQSGTLDLSSRKAKIQLRLDEPAMLYAEITPPKDGSKNGKPIVAGAAIAPT